MKQFVQPSDAILHRTLNHFRARKEFSSGVIEGLNNKAKVTMRESYGFRAFRVTELTHRFFKRTSFGSVYISGACICQRRRNSLGGMIRVYFQIAGKCRRFPVTR